MRVAIVDKSPSTIRYDMFGVEYDLFHLTDAKNAKKKTILKADITLDMAEIAEYDYVICIGADASKHIAKITQVTKYAGEVVKERYIPMINPAMAKFKPEMKPVIESAISKIQSYIDGSYSKKSGDYQGIRCAHDAKKYVEKVLHDTSIKYIAVDTETSSLYPRNGYVCGISISHKKYMGVYIDSDIIDEELETLLQQLFAAKICIFHNAKFDLKMLCFHFGFKFPRWEDTMLLHYILNENEPHDLKFLAMKYTDMGDYDSKLETWKKEYCKKNKILQKNFSYDLIPFEIMAEYAGMDTDATLRIYEMCFPLMDKSKQFTKLYDELLKPGTQFLLDIEEVGVPFDKVELLRVQKDLEENIERLKKDLYKYDEVHMVEKEINGLFNPNSTAQLGKLFFEYLKLPIIKKTATGNASTDAEVLEELSKTNKIAADILSLRKLQKIKSTYIDKVLLNLDNDGRLRTGFNITTTTSGRLSSSGRLNLQQLPRDDKRVKKCIRPEDSNYVFYSQDLKTAEMYYAAVLSGDRALANVFKLGEDFHSSIAHLVFNLPCKISEVKSLYPELRQASKAISFGILYGAGPNKIAETADISIAEAKEIINQYFQKFWKLKQWLGNTQERIGADGYIYSAFGRKRRVPNVFSIDQGERQHSIRSALNFTVQSVASDINLLAAIDMHNWIKQPERQVRAEIFGLVHDSIIGIVHVDDLENFKEQLKYFTQLPRDGVAIPNVPVGVDFEYGESYGHAA